MPYQCSVGVMQCYGVILCSAVMLGVGFNFKPEIWTRLTLFHKNIAQLQLIFESLGHFMVLFETIWKFSGFT